MRHERKQNRVKKKATTNINEVARIRNEKRLAGIYLCPARCPKSLHYCTFAFITSKHYEKHVTAGDKCKFPQGMNSIDRTVAMAAAPGGMMMVGTHRDRKKTSETTLKLFPSSAACPAADDACCFQLFNRKDNKVAYQKPWKLQAFLDKLFAMRPKLNVEQARAIMKSTVDPEDGGLMFCWAKRGEFMAKSNPLYKDWTCSMCGGKPCNCNGMLLALDQITSAFSDRAKKEKKETGGQDYSAARGRRNKDA